MSRNASKPHQKPFFFSWKKRIKKKKLKNSYNKILHKNDSTMTMDYIFSPFVYIPLLLTILIEIIRQTNKQTLTCFKERGVSSLRSGWFITFSWSLFVLLFSITVNSWPFWRWRLCCSRGEIMSATIRNVPVTFIGRVVSANKSVIMPCASPRIVRSIDDIDIFCKDKIKEKLRKFWF